MIPYDKALELALSCVSKPLPTERVLLLDAIDRVLASDIYANRDFPAFDNSAMDGFAIRAASWDKELRLVGEIAAGEHKEIYLNSDEAIKVFTGGAIPSGADCVVRVEDAVLDGNTLKVLKKPAVGQNIRKKGEELKLGELVLKKGTHLRAYEIGLIAGFGIPVIEVYQKPVVGVLSTGDEILDLGEQITKPTQIRSTNNYALVARLSQIGASTLHFGIFPDIKEQIAKAVELALSRCDVVITTGGVSAGEKDFVKEIIKDLGLELVFHKLLVKPAKPVLLAKGKDKLLFGLPGNPVSCLMALDVLVKPVLLKLSGREDYLPKFEVATLKRAFKRSDAQRREFLRGVCWSDSGKLFCDYSDKTQSHMLSSYIDANCYVIVPEGVSSLEEGQKVEILRF
ncbi:MAG: molybdopterin molybdotransferase MoeA [Aquificaceae bacterium]|nr:molybdopterin molybdotransferase MoeA [Aquificaceae bacterium]MDW8237402.1 molybdopterin molybdotransferase MoeA [Aquificaceae bacterium]